MGGIFAKALQRLLGKKEMRILMVRSVLGDSAVLRDPASAPCREALLLLAALHAC